MENIKIEPKEQERIFSDEMRAKIIEREKEIAKHPDEWLTLEQLKKELAKI